MKNNPLNIAGAAALATLLGLGLGGFPAPSSPALAAGSEAEISPGLVLPPLDPVNGKKLFASKGCVVCHAVNGVGGTDAPRVDASTMAPKMNPFDFVAKMWNHSMGMIAMQEHELGGQITFENGKEIGDIIAFLHDAAVQKTFSEADIPADIKDHMEGDEESGSMMGNGSMMNGGSMMNNGSGMNNGSMMGNGNRSMMQGN